MKGANSNGVGGFHRASVKVPRRVAVCVWLVTAPGTGLNELLGAYFIQGTLAREQEDWGRAA